GVGQVVARVRHDLRRGAAAVRGIAVDVREAVPRADGEAGCRPGGGDLAVGCDRAAEPDEDEPVDGRYGDGGARSPAAALGAGRPDELSGYGSRSVPSPEQAGPR